MTTPENTSPISDPTPTRPLELWLKVIDHRLSEAMRELFAEYGIRRRDWRRLKAIARGVGGDQMLARLAARPEKMESLRERGWVVASPSDSPSSASRTDSPTSSPTRDSPTNLSASDSPADSPSSASPSSSPASSPASAPRTDSPANDSPSSDSPATFWTLSPEGERVYAELLEKVTSLRGRVAEAAIPEDLTTTLASLEAIAVELGWNEGGRTPRGFGNHCSRGQHGPREHHRGQLKHRGAHGQCGDRERAREHDREYTHTHARVRSRSEQSNGCTPADPAS